MTEKPETLVYSVSSLLTGMGIVIAMTLGPLWTMELMEKRKPNENHHNPRAKP